MRDITLSKFRMMSVPDIKGSECFRVMGEDGMLFYVIIRPEGLMRDRIEGLCSQIDASRNRVSVKV